MKKRKQPSRHPATSLRSTPDVFIIESLRFVDEEREYSEAKFLAHILKLSGRKYRYFYIRTTAELEAVLDHFEDSNFRYLHLSCHANPNGIALTLDNLSVEELGKLLVPVLNERRLFLSACELATPALATAVLKGSGCYSVIGPSAAVDFDQSALFWASLYYLMFRNEATLMKQAGLQASIAKVATTFDVAIRYFARADSKPNGWREIDVNP